MSDNPTLRKARRLVAEVLFSEAEDSPTTPAVPAWKAWAFVLWIVGVMGVYLASMVGLL